MSYQENIFSTCNNLPSTGCRPAKFGIPGVLDTVNILTYMYNCRTKETPLISILMCMFKLPKPAIKQYMDMA